MARRINSAGAKKLTSITWRAGWPCAGCLLAKWPKLRLHAGVVDQDVETAELLADCVYQALALRIDRQVGGYSTDICSASL